MQQNSGFRRIQLAVVVACVALLPGPLAVAEAQSEASEKPPPLVVFATPGANEGRSSFSDAPLSDEGAATLESIRADPLASDIQIGSSAPDAVLSTRALSLTLPSAPGEGSGTSFDFASVTVEYDDQGLASVHGRNDETKSEVSAVIEGEDVYGWLEQGDEHYRMRPLGDGLTAVFRYDVDKLQHHGPEYPEFIRQQLLERWNTPPWEPPPGAQDSGDVIDVMVVYTPRARTAAGNMSTWIRSAINNSERIYDNTNIRPRLRLVHSYQVNYVEGPRMLDDLNRLTFTDGHMDDVHTRRDQYGADLVVLIVERDHSGTCGIAWINSNPSRGFGVVDEDCEDGHWTFAHEIGHNQGAEHDPDNVVDGNGNRRPPTFSYGQGRCNVTENWSTVMSYRSNDLGTCRERIEYFSSPLRSYRGTPTGDAARRDNRRVLNETAHRIANFRQSVQAPGGDAHTLPLIVADGHHFQQGFVRIINHSDRAGAVEIQPVDDTGRSFRRLTLPLSARQTRHFNSEDLEDGHPRRLPGNGAGNGTGDWRLELESDLEIEPLGYVRTDDGFVTSMHDVVAGDQSTGYHVPFFNEGTHRNQSQLRLVNTSDAEAAVTINAVDDNGRAGSPVRFTLARGGACRISANELESGSATGRCNRDFRGRFGDGHGKWHLTVTADRPIMVMSLMSTPSGHLTNLSTTTGREPGAPPPPPPPPGGPDLVVQSPSVSNPNPAVGETVTFRATVRNQGDGRSAAARVRFFGSADSTISTADVELTTTQPLIVPALNPSESRNISLSGSYSSPLSFYIGACVEPAPNESDRANNCSSGVRVTIGGPGGGTRWGAIAAGWNDRNQPCTRGAGWNAARNASSRSSAASTVLSACQRRGLHDCKVLSQFTACGSIARGFRLQGSSTLCTITGGLGTTQTLAEQSAVSACQSEGYGNCTVLRDGTTGNNATYCNSGFQAPPPPEGHADGVVNSLSGTAEAASHSPESHDAGEAPVEDLLGGFEVEGWTISD